MANSLSRYSRWPVNMITLLILVSNVFLNVGAQAPAVKIRNFTKHDYNAEYQNWMADIGPDHYIYIANNAGMLVYDGVSWEFMQVPQINNLRSVKSDTVTGRIYTAGYREIGFWKWDSLGNLEYTSLTPLAEVHFTTNEEFWNIIILGNEVFFQSFQGVFIFHNGTFEVVRTEGFLNRISKINNQVVIHVRDRGIYRINKGQATAYLTDAFFEDKLVRFLVPWKRDHLLIGTASQGVFEYDGSSYRPVFTDHTDYFITNTLNRGTLIGKDTIVIGTLLDGLTAFSASGEFLFHINEEAGLLNNTVLDIIPYKSNLWVALDRGMSFIDLNPDLSYKIQEVNEIGATYSAAVFENHLFLGTNQGLYAKPLDEEDDSFKLVPGTQSQVWSCKIYDDRLFIGHNDGTFTLKDMKLRKISNVSGGFNITRNSFRINTLFQSTYSDLLMYKKEAGNWMISHRIAGFSNLIRYLETDHLNHLWAGHMRRGVYKLNLNDDQDSITNVTYYGKNSVFNQEYGINVFKIENRIVFTTGTALFTYDDIRDSIIAYDQLNTELGHFASAHRIIKAPGHHYWFITKKSLGLFHFGLHDLKLIKEYPSEIFDYHVIDGYENIIPVDTFRAIYCLENGYAYLDADPSNMSRFAGLTDSLKVRRIGLKGRFGEWSALPLDQQEYIIPYAKNSIRLQFTLPDYTSPYQSFTHRVSELQPEWSDPDPSAEFTLNRIPNGEYLLEVKAINIWGETSAPLQLEFKVLSPWYRSVIAWILYTLLLLFVITFVRSRSIKNVKQREKKKQDRNEQELIKLRNQNLQTELSFKSRELANTTMSIIKKNEFLLHLKEVLKDQKYQLGTRYPDKFYNHIITKLDKNISSGDDWKIFETNVKEAHEFFLQKLIKEYPQLTHSDLRLCSYLRMNLSSKEIAPLMKISIRGVENHRYKLRKKLNLPRDINLTDFILAFEA